MNLTVIRPLVIAVAITLVATACSSTPEDREVVLLTHDSFALSQERLDLFTSETGITLILERDLTTILCKSSS